MATIQKNLAGKVNNLQAKLQSTEEALAHHKSALEKMRLEKIDEKHLANSNMTGAIDCRNGWFHLVDNFKRTHASLSIAIENNDDDVAAHKKARGAAIFDLLTSPSLPDTRPYIQVR